LKKTIKIDNVGRESHTYLYHIINNYDNLADVTIFLPGSSDNGIKKKNSNLLLYKIMKNNNNTIFIGEKYDNVQAYFNNFTLDDWSSTDKSNKHINPESILEKCKDRPYGKWYKKHFPDLLTKYVAYGGIIAISKKHILQHPKSYYENLIQELSTTSNPEVGHYFERSWQAIFSPMDDAIFIDTNNY